MMITITCTDKEIRVAGHASDAEHPRNEETVQACASITALVQTLMSAIHHLCNEYPPYSIGKGNFVLDKTNLSKQAQFCTDVFIIGCRYVQSGYPDHIIVQA